jgi:pyruvate dehydrogenase E1 component
VVATLKKLADEGEVDARLVKDAISNFELDTDRPVAWAPQAHPEVQQLLNTMKHKQVK